MLILSIANKRSRSTHHGHDIVDIYLLGFRLDAHAELGVGLERGGVLGASQTSALKCSDEVGERSVLLLGLDGRTIQVNTILYLEIRIKVEINRDVSDIFSLLFIIRRIGVLGICNKCTRRLYSIACEVLLTMTKGMLFSPTAVS